MKIRSTGPMVLHAQRRTDGQTDAGHDEANTPFLQFCEQAKNRLVFYSLITTSFS
jgi:hypothetical protein